MIKILQVDPKRGRVVVDADGVELTVQEEEGQLKVFRAKMSPKHSRPTKSALGIAARKAAEALREARVKGQIELQL